MIINRKQQAFGCPSFFDIAGYLFCFILCFAMVLVELWVVSVTGVRDAPVSVWPITAALLLVIGWSGLWLGRGWFGRGGD